MSKSEKIYTKICSLPGCGLEFQTTKGNKKYCSEECVRTAHYMWNEMKYNEKKKSQEEAGKRFLKYLDEREQKETELIVKAAEKMRAKGSLLVGTPRMEQI